MSDVAILLSPVPSVKRPGYEHPVGSRISIHARWADKGWLGEIALPREDGRHEYDLLDLPYCIVDPGKAPP